MVVKTHKYADGGKIVKDHTAAPPKKSAPPPPKKGEVSVGKPVETGKTLRGIRAKQMEDLGI